MTRLAYIGPAESEAKLLQRLDNEHFPIISCDTETVTTKDRRCIGVGIGLGEHEAVYFPIMKETTPYIDLIWKLLSRAQTVIFHNAIYDLTVLMEWLIVLEALGRGGTAWAGYRWRVPREIQDLAVKAQDTSLMAQVQGMAVRALQDMSHRYIGYEIDSISDVLPERSTMLDLPTATVAEKCLHDVLATRRLWYKMRGPEWGQNSGLCWTYDPNLQGIGWNPSEPLTYYATEGMQDCYRVDIRLIPLLLHMTARGIRLRRDRVEHWYRTLSHERLFYADICNKEGFNPGSPQQVGLTLATRGNFLPFNKNGKTLSLVTNKEALEELSDPLAQVILEHRRLSKLLSTYFRPWRNKQRGYTHFRQDLSTSRLSSFDRNFQNIPEPARDVFEADNGQWSWMDYNQLETRILANITNEPTMLAAYERGDDAHWITQQRLWPGTDRKDSAFRLKAKTFNHAMSYRAMPKTLAKRTGLPLSVATHFREDWLDTYPEVDRWQQETITFGLENEWVENMLGRRCRLPSAEIAVLSHREKCAVNYPIQSTAADIVKRAMLHPSIVNLDQTLQVHDEILIDGRVEFPKELEYVGPLHTPFEPKQGAVWV